MTMFPNALEQLSQHHARQKIDLFRAIVAINCSQEAGFFLCAYHLPICAPEFKSRPIRPCRSVCEKVKADCMATIRRYKGKWPEDVVCEDLPSYDSDVCVTRDSFVPSGKEINYTFILYFNFVIVRFRNPSLTVRGDYSFFSYTKRSILQIRNFHNSTFSSDLRKLMSFKSLAFVFHV